MSNTNKKVEGEIKRYIKGRLAEVIVEQLFMRAGYVMLRYGYESIAQHLVQGSDWHTKPLLQQFKEIVQKFYSKG